MITFNCPVYIVILVTSFFYAKSNDMRKPDELDLPVPSILQATSTSVPPILTKKLLSEDSVLKMQQKSNLNLSDTFLNRKNTLSSKARKGVGVFMPAVSSNTTNTSASLEIESSSSISSQDNKNVKDLKNENEKMITGTSYTNGDKHHVLKKIIPILKESSEETDDLRQSNSSGGNNTVLDQSLEAVDDNSSSEDISDEEPGKVSNDSVLTTEKKLKLTSTATPPGITLNEASTTVSSVINSELQKSHPLTTIVPGVNFPQVNESNKRISNFNQSSHEAKEINATDVPHIKRIMSKPATASMVDDTSNTGASSNAAILAIIFSVIGICMIVGFVTYKRMYSYWHRRHYARVDYLIDGLYEM